MQANCDELAQQVNEAQMNGSGCKTKEMLIGTITRDPAPSVSLCDETVDRVSTFKLLGVHVSNDLKWMQHVNTVVCKAESCLHFLKQLKHTA